MIYDIASRESRALTRDDFWDAQPAWSPDGETIIYDSYRGGRWNLYKFELGSGRVSALTSPDRDEQHATFTNQPGQIAFQSVTRFPGRLFVMDTDGSWAVRTVEIPPNTGSHLHLLFGNRAALDIDWTRHPRAGLAGGTATAPSPNPESRHRTRACVPRWTRRSLCRQG